MMCDFGVLYGVVFLVIEVVLESHCVFVKDCCRMVMLVCDFGVVWCFVSGGRMVLMV